MRQIHVCAWLLVTSLTVAACSGEKFTESEQASGGNETPAETSAGKPSRNHAGSSSSSAGSLALDSGGQSASGGSASSGGTGTASAGAGYASGGAPSSAGSSAGGDAAGAPSEECPSGAITFRMLPGPDLGKDFLCDAGCGTGWLTITDAEGATAFSIFSACGTASCESCQMLACAAAACLPTPLTAEGSELVWTGTYLAKDTCGANMACQRQACVMPGRYKAKACAAVNGGPSSNGSLACTPKTEQLCAEADFEFPATTTVKLVLKK
jgi:hypothetical protein